MSFVLTEEYVPIIDPVIGEVHFTSPYSALSRIVLKIDPKVSPRDVGEQYRALREGVLEPRHRDINAKHRHPAVFYSERGKETTWRDLMSEWNRVSGNRDGWGYRSIPRFRQDSITALNRLLNPDYKILMPKEQDDAETRKQ